MCQRVIIVAHERNTNMQQVAVAEVGESITARTGQETGKLASVAFRRYRDPNGNLQAVDNEVKIFYCEKAVWKRGKRRVGKLAWVGNREDRGGVSYYHIYS